MRSDKGAIRPYNPPTFVAYEEKPWAKIALRLVLAVILSPLWLPMGLLIGIATFTMEGEWHWPFEWDWE